MNQSSFKTFRRILHRARIKRLEFCEKHPCFVFVFWFLIILSAIVLYITPFQSIAIACFTVTAISVLIYANTGNYAETGLAFIIGLFTAFTVDWTPGKLMLFCFFSVLFVILIAAIYIIRIIWRADDILNDAANRLHLDNDAERKQLDALCSKMINYFYVHYDLIEQAESIRYLSSRKVPLTHLKELHNVIRLITTESDLSASKATDLVYTLWLSFGGDSQIEWMQHYHRFWDKARSLECLPSEFYVIYKGTRKYLIAKLITHDKYMEYISSKTRIGLTPEEIVADFINHFGII